MLGVIWSQVGWGTFCVAWGLGFAALGRVLLGRDEYNARVSEQRWRIFRFVDWRLLSGRMDKEEWKKRDLRQQRLVMKWAMVPGGLVFAALALTAVVHGLIA